MCTDSMNEASALIRAKVNSKSSFQLETTSAEPYSAAPESSDKDQENTTSLMRDSMVRVRVTLFSRPKDEVANNDSGD